jgi:hypothetical protein
LSLLRCEGQKRHTDRTDLDARFGATDIVLASGEEGVEEVRKLTGGHG